MADEIVGYLTKSENADVANVLAMSQGAVAMLYAHERWTSLHAWRDKVREFGLKPVGTVAGEYWGTPLAYPTPVPTVLRAIARLQAKCDGAASNIGAALQPLLGLFDMAELSPPVAAVELANVPRWVRKDFIVAYTTFGDYSWWEFWKESCLAVISTFLLPGRDDGVLQVSRSPLPLAHEIAGNPDDSCHTDRGWDPWSLRDIEVLGPLCAYTPAHAIDSSICSLP